VLKDILGNRFSIWCTSLGLGDTICATPTIRELRRRFPGHGIDVYSYYPELFTYNPHVNNAYFLEEKHELDGSYTNLRQYGYAVFFQTFFSSKFKPQVDYYANSIIDTCSLIALNERLLDQDKWLEVPIMEKDYDSLKEKIHDSTLDLGKAVVIHPSVTWPTRTWPSERWQDLTNMLLKTGFPVIAVGSTLPVIERRNQLQAISMHTCPRGAIDLIDRLFMLETIALLNQCKAVITVDSGLLHMALCTPIDIVGMFTIVHPQFRLAWRETGFDHRFAEVEPNSKCRYCSSRRDQEIKDYKDCPNGKIPPCMPEAENVFETFNKLTSFFAGKNGEIKNHNFKKYNPKQKGGTMQPTTINPDVVCQQAIQAKLNVYQAKEQFETILKVYNDQLDNLINLVSLMKNRILELEGELERAKEKSAKKTEETIA
jgi:ADP-heptose:LPS heptosyltransferase